MITGFIVWVAVALAAAFCLAWLVRPALRARIERPKYRFQEEVRRFDEAARDGSR